MHVRSGFDEGRGVSPAQGHGRDPRCVRVRGGVEISGPPHAVRDVGEEPRSSAVQHAHAVQGGARRDAVVRAEHGSGAVRSVAVAVVRISVVVHEVETRADTSGELRVVGVDAGIDDVLSEWERKGSVLSLEYGFVTVASTGKCY